MSILFHNGVVMLADRAVAGHSVLIRGGRIVTIGPDGRVPSDGATVIDLQGRFLGPGFIDLHCHAGGSVWAHDDPQAAAEFHLAHGTTAMLATTILHETHEQNLAAVRTIADGVHAGLTRTVRGIHMEGPYLNPDFGAYRERSRLPQAAEYRQFAEAAQGLLRTMTIAPEVPGTERMVHDLQALTGGKIVFSVGHSRASLAQVRELIPAGLRIATHVFNASGCAIDPVRFAGTREFGLDEAVLLEDGLMAEVVVDHAGWHVRPEMVQLLCRVKGRDKVVLITDATAADGPPPVELTSVDGPRDVNFNDDGGLAGSALTMDVAVSNLVRHTHLGWADAWRMASYNPAAVHGWLHEVGHLAPGRRADLVVAHETGGRLTIDDVWLAGERVKEGS